MQPDHRPIAVGNFRHLAEALTKSSDVLAAAKSVESEAWQKKNEAERQKEAVKQIHDCWAARCGLRTSFCALDVTSFDWIDADAVTLVYEWWNRNGNPVFKRRRFVDI